MQKFRKKPVEIEAVQFTEANKSVIVSWLQENGASCVFGGQGVEIQTLEGIMLARLGDWIIRGVEGEFYPRKDHIFWKTYERVDDEQQG